MHGRNTTSGIIEFRAIRIERRDCTINVLKRRDRIMVSFTVRLRFDPEDHEKVTDMLCHLTEASRKEPGASATFPTLLKATTRTVLIYEQYQDEAARDFHRNTPHFAQYAIGGLYQLMKDRQLENLTAVC